jgi:hypothetical protein
MDFHAQGRDTLLSIELADIAASLSGDGAEVT